MKQPTALREADHYRVVWHIDADPGVTLNDTLDPTFWAHVARRLRPRARIEVHAADNSWFAELIVRSASNLEAHVAVMRYVDLDAADREARKTAAKISLTVVRKGPTLKWCVVQNPGNIVLVDRLETRADAEAWLENPPQQAQAA